MTFALSTNWCNRRIAEGEAIADLAGELGFDALELGFHTTPEQAKGFRSRLGTMPVGSVHAFCPVPLSAPYGHPELYSLAAPDPDARALARHHVGETVRFAADMGARSVVLHAGRVGLSRLLRPMDSERLRTLLLKSKGETDAKAYAAALARARRVRAARGARVMEFFAEEVERLIPLLQEKNVTLAFENLPYLEGFPDEAETVALLARFAHAPVKAWFDTGHDRVRRCHAWCADAPAPDAQTYVGLHINDVADLRDDHLPPGEGAVDFSTLAPLARTVRHRVFEPSAAVSRERLEAGLARLRRLWAEPAEEKTA